MGGKKTLLASGALVGLCAILLTYLGNPANMGFCIACFIRDIAGSLGLHRAEAVQYIRPEIIGIVCGVFAHKVFKLQDLSAADGVKYYVAVIGSAFSGLLVNVFTDPFLGYFRNRYIFGQEADLASTVAKITSGVTLINSLLSTVCAVVLFLALVPALRKANLLPAADKPE